MAGFEITASRARLLQLFRKERLNKIPAYVKDIDHLLGMIYARDVYLNPERSVRDLVRPVNYVPEQMTADKLLDHFRSTRTQLAVVVDEYGGVSGVVTLEDVAEQIIGDIADEQEDSEPVRQVGPRAFLLAGDLDIQAWKKASGIVPPDSRINTIGGLIAAHLGRVPSEDDQVQIGNMKMTVQQMRGKRVRRVLIELAEEEAS